MELTPWTSRPSSATFFEVPACAAKQGEAVNPVLQSKSRAPNQGDRMSAATKPAKKLVNKHFAVEMVQTESVIEPAMSESRFDAVSTGDIKQLWAASFQQAHLSAEKSFEASRQLQGHVHRVQRHSLLLRSCSQFGALADASESISKPGIRSAVSSLTSDSSNARISSSSSRSFHHGSNRRISIPQAHSSACLRRPQSSPPLKCMELLESRLQLERSYTKHSEKHGHGSLDNIMIRKHMIQETSSTAAGKNVTAPTSFHACDNNSNPKLLSRRHINQSKVEAVLPDLTASEFSGESATARLPRGLPHHAQQRSLRRSQPCSVAACQPSFVGFVAPSWRPREAKTNKQDVDACGLLHMYGFGASSNAFLDALHQ
mmetsp:Transcript_57656/g.125230  ORF Transcript_57656/g.125230 Transcript_57656/m.125230 type:complete len:373 (-) Transcript_57656:152-1270(-)